MRKGHTTSGKNHQNSEHFLDVLDTVDIAIDLDAAQQQRANKSQYETYGSGNYHRIRELGPHAQIDINTDMLQALQQRHHADHEANHPHVNGHIFSCPFKSIFVI